MSAALRERTWVELEGELSRGAVLIVPVGSVEPHGPHLPLGTDAVLAEESAHRAAAALTAEGIVALVAPTVPFGVTDFAEGFAGALGVSAPVLTAYLTDVVGRALRERFVHVCLVTHHLEPAHDAAVRAAAAAFADGLVSVACPLSRRWGRELSAEFKRGNCHAGRYETSLMMAAGSKPREGYRALAPLDASLADAIRAGKDRFADIGMTDAYTGAPSEASAEEGQALYDKHVVMIATEVREALARLDARSTPREGEP